MENAFPVRARASGVTGAEDHQKSANEPDQSEGEQNLGYSDGRPLADCPLRRHLLSPPFPFTPLLVPKA